MEECLKGRARQRSKGAQGDRGEHWKGLSQGDRFVPEEGRSAGGSEGENEKIRRLVKKKTSWPKGGPLSVN